MTALSDHCSSSDPPLLILFKVPAERDEVRLDDEGFTAQQRKLEKCSESHTDTTLLLFLLQTTSSSQSVFIFEM